MTIRLSATAVVIAGTLLLGSPAARGQGIVVPGVGPINRSMGGAAAAAPLEAAGAIHWNPATLTGLPGSQVVVGLELLLLSSHVEFAGASTRSDAGVSALPAFALAWQPEESPWSFGLGLFTVGGFGTNYPLDPTNPILAAGPIYSRLQVLQLVPAAALQVTEHLSVGIAPTLSMADAALDVPGGPELTHGTLRWGGGFQAGVYYATDSCWQFGLSYKSPQWFESFDFNTDTGTVSLDLDYPAIYTLGVAYAGFPRLVWAVDLRYVDYENADFLGDSPLAGGLGWQSVFSIATGVQYQLNDAFSMRLGYVFNENPVPAHLSALNIPAAAIYQHIAAVGLSCQITQRTSLSVAYLRAFDNSITGPSPLPVTNRVYIDSLIAGLEVKF